MAAAMQVNLQVRGIQQGVAQLNQLARALRQNGQLANQINIYNAPRAGGGGGGGGRSRSNFGSRLAGLIGSTRFAAGPFSPLIGRAAGLFGGAGGPLTVAAGMAAGPVTLLGMASKKAADALGEITGALRVSGGNQGDLARLAGMGLGGPNAGDLANRVRAEIASNPLARVRAAQMGMGAILPEPFGPTNNMKILADITERLRNIKDPGERLRTARLFGMEGELGKLDISPEILRKRQQDAERMAKVMTPQVTQNGKDFLALLDDIGRLFGEMVMTFSAQFGGEINMFLRAFADNMRSAMKAAETAGIFIRDTIRTYFIEPAVWLATFASTRSVDMANMGVQAWKMAQGVLDQHNKNVAAVNANTKAVNANTAAMTAGTFGGGPRGRGAIPSNLRGQAMTDAMNGRAQAFGAWSL